MIPEFELSVLGWHSLVCAARRSNCCLLDWRLGLLPGISGCAGSRSDCMAGRVIPRRRGSYGIDAPFAPALLAGLVILYLLLAIVTGRAGFWLAVLFISALEALFIHTALRGKFVIWAELLDGLRLRGDERILDLGCGRGAVLLMAAQHLTTGRAVGVDLWRKVDQSGNSAEATQRNAVAEGVADRVELHTGDLRALPFEDNG